MEEKEDLGGIEQKAERVARDFRVDGLAK